MTATEATRFPIVIAEWQRNSREMLRVSLDRFNNRNTIDIRSWWRDSDGAFKPGRSGLTLAVKHLPSLADGLAHALQRARILGLIEPTTNSKDRTAAERQRRYRQRRNGAAA
jgi:Transcriptional Coactivator p15 (PC4)